MVRENQLLQAVYDCYMHTVALLPELTHEEGMHQRDEGEEESQQNKILVEDAITKPSTVYDRCTPVCVCVYTRVPSDANLDSLSIRVNGSTRGT